MLSVTTWTVSFVGRQWVTRCYLKSCCGCRVYAFLISVFLLMLDFSPCLYVCWKGWVTFFALCILIFTVHSHWPTESCWIEFLPWHHMLWHMFEISVGCYKILKVMDLSKKGQVDSACHVGYRGSRSVAPIILNRCSRGRCVVTFTFPATLPLGEKSPCAHWMGGCVGSKDDLEILEKRNLLLLPGFEP